MIVDASLIIDAIADPGPRGIAARDALAAQPVAERHGTSLLTADSRIERSGAPITCEIITVAPAGGRSRPQCPTHRQEATFMTLRRRGHDAALAGGGDPATPAGS